MTTTEQDLLILLPFIYIIPSYVVYLVEFVVLYKQRKTTNLSGHFFNIWIASSVNNIVCHVTFFLTYRGTRSPSLYGFYSILPSSGVFTTFIMFVVYFAGSSQAVFDLLLCFNRFTVVFLNTRYVAFWSRFGLFLILLPIAVPLLTSWEAWWFDIKLYPSDATDYTKGYAWVATNYAAVPFMKIPLIVGGTVIVTAGLSFVMNLYVCWYLVKQKRGKGATGGKKMSRHDIKLFFYNLLIFFTQFVQLFLQIIFLLVPATHSLYAFCRSIQYFVMDITSLAPAWFILFTSEALRNSILGMYGSGVTRTSVVALVSGSNGNPKSTVKTDRKSGW